MRRFGASLFGDMLAGIAGAGNAAGWFKPQEMSSTASLLLPCRHSMQYFGRVSVAPAKLLGGRVPGLCPGLEANVLHVPDKQTPRHGIGQNGGAVETAALGFAAAEGKCAATPVRRVVSVSP